MRWRGTSGLERRDESDFNELTSFLAGRFTNFFRINGASVARPPDILLFCAAKDQNSCGKENETSLVDCMYKLAGIYQIPEQRK